MGLHAGFPVCYGSFDLSRLEKQAHICRIMRVPAHARGLPSISSEEKNILSLNTLDRALSFVHASISALDVVYIATAYPQVSIPQKNGF